VDALQILLTTKIPPFRIRIVGGAAPEAGIVEDAIRQTEACNKALREGRIEVWSSVDRAALPEVYSRSTVVCIPSIREQFGMVAIEAMMCGVPVVASRTGGLQDLVIHNMTGYLVDRLNPFALAAALAQFVRAPSLGEWMGQNALLWTRNRFALSTVADRYLALYDAAKRDALPIPEEQSGAALLRQRVMETNREAVERLTGPLVAWHDVSSGYASSFIVETSSGKYFVKFHPKRPSFLTCLTGGQWETSASLIPAERARLARFLSAASVAPRLLSADEDSGVLVHESLLSCPEVSEQAAEALMLEASADIQSLVAVEGQDAECFLQALRATAMADDEEEATNLVDHAVLTLNSSIMGVKPYLRECHPQIELARIAGYIRSNPRLVRQEFGIRASSLVSFLIAQHPLIYACPRLQHGSMKRAHLMKRPDGTVALCDVDRTALYVGPHDIASWFHNEHLHAKAPAPYRMLRSIYRLANSDDDRFLGAVWLAIFPIFEALWRFARGDWELRTWDMQFLAAYPEAFRKVFIPSEETAGSHSGVLGT